MRDVVGEQCQQCPTQTQVEIAPRLRPGAAGHQRHDGSGDGADETGKTIGRVESTQGVHAGNQEQGANDVGEAVGPHAGRNESDDGGGGREGQLQPEALATVQALIGARHADQQQAQRQAHGNRQARLDDVQQESIATDGNQGSNGEQDTQSAGHGACMQRIALEAGGGTIRGQGSTQCAAFAGPLWNLRRDGCRREDQTKDGDEDDSDQQRCRNREYGIHAHDDSEVPSSASVAFRI